ncbi:WD40 repeat-like protein [Thozetella sp. PMI_491]|nr:WD40 repeat-like protein [Thozetella sp. PMI_491]
MSSFFTNPGAHKKRKRLASSDAPKKRVATSASTPKPTVNGGRPTMSSDRRARGSDRRTERDDESISGSDEESDENDLELPDGDDSGTDSDGSDLAAETAAEKRLRLAQRYLDKVAQEEVDTIGFDAADIDRDLIAERLEEDVAESKGKVYRKLASKLAFSKATHSHFRWNTDNATSVAVCPPFAYTADKKGELVKWRIQDLPKDQWPQSTKKKPKKQAPPKRRPDWICSTRADSRRTKDKQYQGHVGPILTVKASEDGKFVVTGGADRRLVIFDAETLKPIRMMGHHRDAVTGLAFRRGTNQLYSCSKDRTVKVWSIEELAYVETLFGHQDECVDIDALAQERCLSVGARDRTARLWKVVEESQLVFRGGSSEKKTKTPPGVDPKSLAHEGSMDRVAMIDNELFVTGSDSGSLSLWSIQKKKPLFVLPRAHGIEPALKLSETSAEQNPDPAVVPPPQPRWITALRTVPYSDLFFSGSWDGCVRVWRLSDDKKKIEAVGVLGPGNSTDSKPSGQVNGEETHAEDDEVSEGPKLIKGVINDIALFERGERGKDGLSVVVATGKEIRLGRWKVGKGGKCGATVFEVPRVEQARANGASQSSEDEDEEESEA